MKTYRLYYDSSYTREFDATVIECIRSDKISDKYHVILDKTAFFPEGGGQSGDKGFFNDCHVTDTLIIDNEITHITDKAFDIGDRVHCILDFDTRYTRMQNHTGEHIVSGIIHTLYGYNNVGFHLSDKTVTLDIDGYLTPDELCDIEIRANRAVWNNVTVGSLFYRHDELSEISFRSKLDHINIDEDVRIIEIDGYDKCACCAPHVAKTGEIGIIKIIDSTRYKGGTRISLVCGMYALLDYDRRVASDKRLSASLSLPEKDLVLGVEKLFSDISNLKAEIRLLKNLFTDSVISSLPLGKKHICIFENLDDTEMRKVVNEGMRLCDGICAIFSGDDKGGYKYSMGSLAVDMRNFSKSFNSKLNGRGGGSSNMIQGNVSSDKSSICEFFDSLE